jgi:hypothetical protein
MVHFYGSDFTARCFRVKLWVFLFFLKNLALNSISLTQRRKERKGKPGHKNFNGLQRTGIRGILYSIIDPGCFQLPTSDMEIFTWSFERKNKTPPPPQRWGLFKLSNHATSWQPGMGKGYGSMDLSLFLPSLLKTFSINPFQSQCPNMLVRISATPISPRTHRKPAEMKKAETIKMIPMTDRKIASPLAIFFIITVGPLPCYSISVLA